MTINHGYITFNNVNEPEHFGNNLINALFETYNEADILNGKTSHFYSDDDKEIISFDCKIMGRGYCCQIEKTLNTDNTYEWYVVPEDSIYIE